MAVDNSGVQSVLDQASSLHSSAVMSVHACQQLKPFLGGSKTISHPCMTNRMLNAATEFRWPLAVAGPQSQRSVLVEIIGSRH